ncbi:DNA internalization-related competence protein ComEC/Rec2 [Catenovulum agarivorans DS-2]|uniref:DNA internalization-related competence protein ComEC/Rec2 n=1 Tax=Catenovulum agarivorans DS-2 TaxID=1328313 RepID=W7QX04_9ALTE|nr:DNA internalization-related competence protein ComEC/Rec2 [Catenovulum agarivorans]EWH12263.1 DNA internalization-related competence protein ComEC/Rec2 [Catenovulum agarivorans DS-2]
MEACLLSFIVGNLVANNLPILFTVNELLVTAVLIGSAIILRYYKIASVLIGLCSVSAFMQWQSLSPIVADNQAQTRIIQAKVTQVSTEVAADGQIQQKLNVVVACVYIDNRCQRSVLQPQTKLRLSYYRAAVALELDQVAKLTVKLKPARGFNNESGFDFQRWLISQNIFATGYIIKAQVLTEHESKRAGWHRELKTLYKNYLYSDLMLALTTGDRSWMTDEHWQLLRTTGTAHLLAISGLHLGLVFAGCYWILRLLFLPWRTSSYFVYQTLIKLCALFCVWFFYFFCEQSIPILRACIFISVWVGCGFIRVNWGSQARFLFALALILCILPLSPLSMSFWLSFAAVAIVLISLHLMKSLRLNQHHVLLRMVYLQFAISILLLPVQMLYFQLLPTASLPANLLAIPWVSLIILPCLVLAALSNFILSQSISQFLLNIAEANLSWLFNCLQWFEQHFVALPSSQMYLLVVVCCIAWIMLWWFRPASKVFKPAFVFILPTAIGFASQLSINHASWRVHMLDVGQGLAVLLEDGQSAVLYDTGDKFSSGFNLFEAVVQPLLVARGLELKHVVISHSDKDHAGGIENVAELWPNAHIYQGQKGCEQVDGKVWLNLTWQSWLNVNADNSNNGSCVVCISKASTNMCLTGDIEKQTEHWLLQQVNFVQLLPVDLLLVAHHGSKTSTSEAFIQAVAPKVAWISRGHLNRFNHPHPTVVARIQNQQSTIYDTSLNGHTKLHLFNSGELKIQSYLPSNLAPWYRSGLN